ncbi:type IV toxin-antitoxin system AbiEi family antitoxin domain-containing protein [Pseudarthrobacter sp. HLT3-5]|uniref:type IV toxin-antitoxin system AbiEi family antitoxin domain-containing protein n=1 Tax=Pseudarthrobacter cellobiosi TaxID=2953654 RepID=UPI00208EA806|nr:type IV toxin-antitoxin system AbiEi family antitoxin domain-containing protein [Pseudarthrobacter sp. HLT3-5]MCO4275497.1 type IV toxin-antitoxin system AbiEi family antitoxin domain-containing protein [Pseudarthrobacter sp. HLT3-5]
MTNNAQLTMPTGGMLPTGMDLWRTGELQESGLNARKVSALVRAGDLVRLRRGCYIRGSTWAAQKPWVRSRQLIAAHAHGTLTTSGGGFVYSHTSAARLHRLYLWDVDDYVHITQESAPSRTSHGRDVVTHTRSLQTADIVFVDGMPCTSLERTVVDCCLMLTYRQALVLIDHALRMGADLEKIRRMSASLAGRNGVRTLRRAIENADARSESPGETLTRELIHRLCIEPPELQVVAWSADGQYRLDFDGRVKYFDYEPTDEVIYKERQREKALTEEGWTFIRIKWQDLFQEHEFKMRVLRALRNVS